MASVQSRAVQQAIGFLGGIDEVAQYLDVPVEEVARWVRDREKPPREALLRVVDLILEETREPGTASTSEEAPIRPPSCPTPPGSQ